MRKLLAALLSVSVLCFSFAAQYQTAYAAANTFSTTLANASTQFWSITNASQSGLGVTSSFTASIWVKFNSLPSANFDTAPLVAKGDLGTNTGYQWLIYKDGSGVLNFITWIKSDNVNVAYTPTTGTWLFLTVVYNAGAKTVTYYVNGSQQGSPGATVNASITNGATDFTVGKAGYSPNSKTLDAKVDEVLFYNTNLSGAQVSALYSTPCTPSTTNLVSEWRFNNNGADSFGSNTLTNNGTATFTTDTPFTCASATFTGFMHPF